MYAFFIQTVAVSQLQKQLAEVKDIEMVRKANGQGHTYKVGNSYRTVIRKGDHCTTATATPLCLAVISPLPFSLSPPCPRVLSC
jgi:hypothetical protein